MFTTLWVSHCWVTSVFKCVAVNSLGILNKVRHARIIWDDQHISHNSKEERLTYMHNFLFSYVFLPSVGANRGNYCLFVGHYSLTIIALQPQVFFIHLMGCSFTCTSRPESASSSQQIWLFHHSSLTHHWHPYCEHSPILLYLTRVFWKHLVGWKRFYQIHSLQDFVLQVNSLIYYACWARISLLLVFFPANYWEIYFRKKIIVITYSSLHPFIYFSDITRNLFHPSSKTKDLKE